MVVESDGRFERSFDIFSRLLRERIVFLGTEVWEALTEPERLEEWFATEVELDAQPGGEGIFRWGDGDERRAVVREAEPQERLVLDWEDDGQVVLELEEVDGGTRVRVVERSPEWSTALELHALAWVAVA